MLNIGGYLIFFGLGSMILNAVGYEFVIISWIDSWGESIGWGIRVGLVAVGAVVGGYGLYQNNRTGSFLNDINKQYKQKTVNFPALEDEKKVYVEIRALVSLVSEIIKADGKVDEEEKELLSLMLKDFGLPEKLVGDLVRIVEEDMAVADPDNVNYAISILKQGDYARDPEHQKDLINICLGFASVDNDLNERELKLVRDIGEKLGLEKSLVEELIQNLQGEMAREKT
ncbi:MAG: TerB family tellurite resistance protein [Spirochaetota bacterium]|nr:TerB family tellurite resistance protein [Spirochaetota bacterium]